MTLKKLISALGLAGVGFFTATVQAQPVQVDPALPTYQKAAGVSGNFTSIGSDTLNNLMTLWAEEFKRLYPNVNIQIQGAGSSTAPPALTEGASNFGPMSRLMTAREVEAFEKKHGYKPTAIGVAIDALAVYVNKDNPIKGLSLEEVDAIMSSTRKCGGAADITKWGQLGLGGEWANRDIAMYSRNSVSGTYGFFKDVALCKGDFKRNVAEQPGSASVVQSVATQLNAIGYSGIGYKTSGVRALPLSKKKGEPFVEPDATHAIDGTYPLARVLYVYVNKKPNQPLAPLEKEFFRMVLSKQGQEVVIKDGFVPVPNSLAQRYLALLN
ncbi:phosphate ABC transporter substrate-binding protein PstS family protein [Calidifontimicrobium sp. SYSU G02091]|uniref:PstS family phosphate ABC transporter substrate-binding protein n=1 Tax=Calidifontimicrobium sp. SYSU G02091 TaxID=2926421 RepID=UPI001F53D7FC|nr:phosphate ABC transporter substrate-binding protein PstS family protein [Calidifontimicrobium sp. SYSU G02091]MCI1192769.1 phosphate ABC transporter substrate-binding protein PstS family protein [Calidifontimicrobium sp. SYSU G02091]